ncbi:hypothetical protein EGW08_009604 [Elysia chlorotica]|uniref:Uncharacterized protein n=1 Tax=Elysia chlorotica TaxID=188477 RepID=A0A3S0ZTU7_ELYCH|nr:hypothetical protein EGW08_009604 [Elysia chlorotica]
MLDLSADDTSSTPNPLGQNVKSGLESGKPDVTVRPVQDQEHNVDEESLSDVVAALVSAILALTFLLLLICIIRIIKKRRRQLQGMRFNQPVIQTISPGAFTASTAAYSQHIHTAGGISWERVDTERRREPSPHLRDYYRLDSAHTSIEVHGFQASGSSRPSLPIQQFQQSCDMQFSRAAELEASSSLPSDNTSHSDQLIPSSQQLQQLSASPSSSSFLHIVQVDAVLHRTPSLEVLSAPEQSSDHLFLSLYPSSPQIL